MKRGRVKTLPYKIVCKNEKRINTMNGIVIIDKPQGWTSQDVTARLRRVFNTRRIGHGGTLDPMATGVLPVFVDRATRGVEFFEHAEKTYEATLRLGLTTDTEDTSGTVLEEKEVRIAKEEFLGILPKFRGDIQQIPPMYSALKIDGQKLCDLARKGKTVERKPRTITIFKLECLEFSGNTARLLVHCSKGTYIRTLLLLFLQLSKMRYVVSCLTAHHVADMIFLVSFT